MRTMITIALHQLRLVFGSRSTLITMFVGPLAFISIFGSMGTGTSGVKAYPVALVDHDGSVVSGKLLAALEAEPILDIKRATEDELTRLLADKKVVAGVRIPSGFGESLTAESPLDVELITPPEGDMQRVVQPAVARLVAAVGSDWRLALQAAGGAGGAAEAYDRIAADRATLGATVRETAARAAQSGNDRAQLQGTALGFIVMFVLMVSFSAAGVILQERQDGTWGRLLTAPVGRAAVLGGYLLSFFLTGAIQFAGLVAVTALIFRIDWGPPLPLAAVAGSFILCAAGLGLFLAGFARTPAQQNVVGTITVVATSMLGGTFWPLDVVSETMRRIGYLTPQAWAMDGFREAMFRGASPEGLLLPVAVLLGYAALFLAVGIARVRYN